MILYHLEWEALPVHLMGLTLTPTASCVSEAFERGHYKAVAEIEGDDLEFVFKATQNGVLTESWSREPVAGVTPTDPNYIEARGRKFGRRSTSVGDVVELNGERWVVAFVGFENVGSAA